MMSERKIENRKMEHIDINLSKDVTSILGTGLENYSFIHCALPEINYLEIDTSINIFNRKIAFPFLISSMTGGTKTAEEINTRLARTAQEFQLAMGVGSQRIGVDDIKLMFSFQIRKHAPDILLFANLGAVQLNHSYTIDECELAVDAIEADALIFHLNPLQEVLMENGNTDFSNLLMKIEQVCKHLSVPVVVKEVGWGISEPVAKRLLEAGVSAIDVAGAGGTSWSEVERYRAATEPLKIAAEGFRGWGNPTAESIVNIRKLHPHAQIFASGGLRNGLDIAKCIALGASLGGMAHEFLMAAADSEAELRNRTEGYTRQFQIAMFCVGARTIVEFQKNKIRKIN